MDVVMDKLLAFRDATEMQERNVRISVLRAVLIEKACLQEGKVHSNCLVFLEQFPELSQILEEIGFKENETVFRFNDSVTVDMFLENVGLLTDAGVCAAMCTHSSKRHTGIERKLTYFVSKACWCGWNRPVNCAPLAVQQVVYSENAWRGKVDASTSQRQPPVEVSADSVKGRGILAKSMSAALFPIFMEHPCLLVDTKLSLPAEELAKEAGLDDLFAERCWLPMPSVLSRRVSEEEDAMRLFPILGPYTGSYIKEGVFTEKVWTRMKTIVCNFLVAYSLATPDVRAMVDKMAGAPAVGLIPADCEGGFWMRFYTAIALKIHASSYFAEDPVLRISGQVLNLITLFGTHHIAITGGDAYALYSFGCLVNHSCDPNCEQTSAVISIADVSRLAKHLKRINCGFDSALSEAVGVWESTRPIAAGEELTVTYIERDDLSGLVEIPGSLHCMQFNRRGVIWMLRGFLCKCRRCTEEVQSEDPNSVAAVAFKSLLHPL